jgi:hypothetical protein
MTPRPRASEPFKLPLKALEIEAPMKHETPGWWVCDDNGNGRGVIPWVQTEGEARLFAAAPDLLAALKEALNHGANDWDLWVPKARALIARLEPKEGT